jgi:hypothetical protein
MIDPPGIGRPDNVRRSFPNEEPAQDAVTSGRAAIKSSIEQANATTLPAATATAELQINRRESFKTERDQRHGKSVVRIVRLKPSADGGERQAASLEFADRHLSGVIAMLQSLQTREAS